MANKKLVLIILLAPFLCYGQQETYSKGDSKNEINKTVPAKSDSEEYKKLVHGFGFYCHLDKKEAVYDYIKETKEVIHQPFFFTCDPCIGLKPHVLEYFSLLKAYGHAVDESTFANVMDVYYLFNWNLASEQKMKEVLDELDITGKSILMYACEFGYLNSVERILRYADVNLMNVKNQSALTFACKNNNIEVIKLLKKNGAKTNIIDGLGKFPFDYCTSKKAMRMAK